MKTTAIYTNGHSLFTLENYGKTAGINHNLNIELHSEVSTLKARKMHENGLLHYIFGTGDMSVLSDVSINRKMKLKRFEIS